MSNVKCLVVGYTAKKGEMEFSSFNGYKVQEGAIPGHSDIRRSCLDWANRDGDGFDYIRINFMTFMSEDDYDSFMEVKVK